MLGTVPRHLLMLFALAACSRGPFSVRASARSPHEAYARSLHEAGLARTALGRDWLAAGDRVLAAPVEGTTPLREEGFFGASEALAVAYRFTLPAGRRVQIRVDAEADSGVRLFADLYQEGDDGARTRRLVASSDSLHATLEADADRTDRWILRLQPELLRPVRYVVSIEGVASLGFPVRGRDSRAVRSRFGQDRDAGAREHQGIDIFAPRGTPALAATAGVAHPAENTLGGHVVFVYDPVRGFSLYYAHLDRQLVHEGELVQVGDTVGLVGNTGNARTTPPHLHFGIYRRGRGAIDPFPFVDTRRALFAAIGADSALIGRVLRTSERTTLRGGPQSSRAAVGTLGRHTMLVADGVAGGGWLRVRLPDDRVGYVASTSIEPAATPIGRESIPATTPLRVRPDAGAVAIYVGGRGAMAPVFGRFGAFALVEVGGRRGWVGGAG